MWAALGVALRVWVERERLYSTGESDIGDTESVLTTPTQTCSRSEAQRRDPRMKGAMTSTAGARTDRAWPGGELGSAVYPDCSWIHRAAVDRSWAWP